MDAIESIKSQINKFKMIGVCLELVDNWTRTIYIESIRDGIETFTIPDGVRNIIKGKSKLSKLKSVSIKKIKFPDTLEVIGDEVFAHWKSVESLEFPDSLKLIGRYAFRGLTKLKA